MWSLPVTHNAAFLQAIIENPDDDSLHLIYADWLDDHGQSAGWGIRYDELHFARSLPDKGRLCRELDLDVYFDDQDECIVGVDERTVVFKVRNGGNFDFQQQKWLSTDRLTRLL